MSLAYTYTKVLKLTRPKILLILSNFCININSTSIEDPWKLTWLPLKSLCYYKLKQILNMKRHLDLQKQINVFFILYPQCRVEATTAFLELNLKMRKTQLHFNSFVPNTSFLYPVKTSENRKVFWCYKGIEKGCIENEWVKGLS